ncbi:MAG TPA: 3-oxoacyl-ACP reductase, partial [Gammaproteobacteria bacterium]|nr:3-oxoacyl-ACP reductase [Gammaproteobacteria bacterium]
MDTSVKVALVSGASRGIGEAIALRLVREGFFVVGTATTNEGAQLIKKKLENGLGVVLDIRSRESTENLFLTLKEKNISPTVLVNNAGITRDNLILRMSEEEWGDVLETNLNGVFRLTKGLVRGMTRARWGRIIN